MAKRITHDTKTKVIEKFLDGVTINIISELLNVSKTSIQKILKESNITRHSRQKPPLYRTFWEKVNKSGECWTWTRSKNSDGYGNISINGKLDKAHRVAWILTNGEIPNKLHVLHTCDNPSCVNPNHLYLGNHQDNMRDKRNRKRGRGQNGEKCHLSKLTENQVKEIRELSSTGISYKDLSKKFNVSYQNIREIVIHKTWRHI